MRKKELYSSELPTWSSIMKEVEQSLKEKMIDRLHLARELMDDDKFNCYASEIQKEAEELGFITDCK
jgi:hypothetical protein